MDQASYDPGSKVVIRFNPHHAGAEGIVGTVVEYRARAGFALCDLVDVQYEDPRDGEVYICPFGLVNLSPGDPKTLLAAADRHEAIVAELRALARQASSRQSVRDHSNLAQSKGPTGAHEVASAAL